MRNGANRSVGSRYDIVTDYDTGQSYYFEHGLFDAERRELVRELERIGHRVIVGLGAPLRLAA